MMLCRDDTGQISRRTQNTMGWAFRPLYGGCLLSELLVFAYAQRGLLYCGWVCLCVCLKSHMEQLLLHVRFETHTQTDPTEFALKTLSPTQQGTKVKNFVGIWLKRLRSRIMQGNTGQLLIIPAYPRSVFSARYTANTQ